MKLLAIVVGCATLPWLLAGCGKKAAAPLAPTPQPPMIEEMFPAPRSIAVPYQTEIWARFGETLDSTTVNARNVILYLDTQVVPTTVSWEAATRRIVIRPLAPLALHRTHTVQFEPDLATAAGGRLGEEYFWQFTTTGVRLPYSPFPPDGAVNESVFATLVWGTNETEYDEVRYDLYLGTDSSTIASRSIPPVNVTSQAYLMPELRRARGTTYFWSVTTRNESTGETSTGPVWRFQTAPVGAPEDSVRLSLSDWSSYKAAVDSTFCFDSRFPVGGSWTAALRWSFAPVGPRRLTYASIRLRFAGHYQPLSVFAAKNYWNACDMHELAAGDRLADMNRDFFTSTDLMYAYSDFLTAHLEASLRHPGFYGYVIAGPTLTSIEEPGCVLSLHYFKE